MRKHYFFESIKIYKASNKDNCFEFHKDFKVDNFHNFVQNKPNDQLKNDVNLSFSFQLYTQDIDNIFEEIDKYLNFIKENSQYILKISFGTNSPNEPYKKEIEIKLLLENLNTNFDNNDWAEFTLYFTSISGSIIKEINCTKFE